MEACGMGEGHVPRVMPSLPSNSFQHDFKDHLTLGDGFPDLEIKNISSKTGNLCTINIKT